ncbi:hypothetical protein MNEG_4873 [Monoraphidium neglectum]|uniref:RRM domain-containing protein n=1 Tax=Monoraphidium neglectum TaxID=145388 RepID=A0A0D2L8D7_9CHLO|nr:hypothetical protein MNEG_4873 [Monoraphidium neglectum]KIZ03089.1 hypothetical protein MNEG_4873 [Monoraphidium neglectum]|eukprot:XP_013902108.1 hypothetical protein MNEG_4873 [Monoraphidium neglectum]
MATTLVAVGGKGSNPKTTLYVGGLEESVNEATLHAAFIPFGDLKDVNIPMDNELGKHRGFGFVEFEDKDDAAAAIDNMHNSELFGRVLRVNFAQPAKIKGGDKGWSHQPVWADADKYIEELAAEQELEAIDREQKKKRQLDTLKPAGGAGGDGGGQEGGADPMEALEAAAAGGT